jgi:hypothetical protein
MFQKSTIFDIKIDQRKTILLFIYDGIENRSGRRGAEESKSAKHKRKPKKYESLEQSVLRKASRKQTSNIRISLKYFSTFPP